MKTSKSLELSDLEIGTKFSVVGLPDSNYELLKLTPGAAAFVRETDGKTAWISLATLVEVVE